MSAIVQAWHFVGATLRDGRPVPPDGVWLRHDGSLKMCAAGLHASVHPFDALQHATEPILCRVECRGDVQHDPDKLVCRERRILRRLDATEGLRYFARLQALSVIHLYLDPPDVVLDYLMTGDKRLRIAAWAAARTAAWPTAWDAAGDAPRAAARAADWTAARAAAADAARAAAWASARAAAADADWAAGDAARDAARAAARAAAWAAARDEWATLVEEAFR